MRGCNTGMFGFRLRGQYFLVRSSCKGSDFVTNLHPEIYLILQKYSSLSAIIAHVDDLKKVSDDYQFDSPQSDDAIALAKYAIEPTPTSWNSLTSGCQNSFIRVLDSGYLNVISFGHEECGRLDAKVVQEYVLVWDLDEHKVWYSYPSQSGNGSIHDLMEDDEDDEAIGSIDDEADLDELIVRSSSRQKVVWNVKQERIHEMISYYKYHPISVTYDEYITYCCTIIRHHEMMTNVLQYRLGLLSEFIENLERPLAKSTHTTRPKPISCQQSIELLENRLGIIKCYFRSIDEEDVYIKCYHEVTWQQPQGTKEGSHEREREIFQQAMKCSHVLRAHIKHHVPFNATSLPQEYCTWEEDQGLLQFCRQQCNKYQLQVRTIKAAKYVDSIHEMMLRRDEYLKSKQKRTFAAM